MSRFYLSSTFYIPFYESPRLFFPSTFVQSCIVRLKPPVSTDLVSDNGLVPCGCTNRSQEDDLEHGVRCVDPGPGSYPTRLQKNPDPGAALTAGRAGPVPKGKAISRERREAEGMASTDDDASRHNSVALALPSFMATPFWMTHQVKKRHLTIVRVLIVRNWYSANVVAVLCSFLRGEWDQFFSASLQD